MPRTTTVRSTTTLRASPREVFELLSDYERAGLVIEGLKELSPVGGQASGVGARFQAIMHLGPKTVTAQIELTDLVQDRLVTWAAVDGDNRSISFELDETEDKAVAMRLTTVALTITYERGDGLPATLLAPVVQESVRSRARDTLQRLRLAAEKAG
ncbi:MAG: SRPBCC family protein [Acidimicrobiales bacterium]